MNQAVINERILGEPVANHCRRDFTTVRASASVDESLAFMRANPPTGRIIYFYVIDDSDKLVGVLPTRRLLLSPGETKLSEVMIRNVIAIPEFATVLEACEFFTLHRLLAFPIVDAQRRIVGVIDVELYTSELAWNPDESTRPKATDELFELIGVHLKDVNQTNPVRAWKSRFPWLLCNIAGGLLAAVLASVYEDVLTWKNAVLALFIPIVLALSESVSIQSVTLAVGRLRDRKPNWGHLLRQGGLEGITGVMLGAGAALIVAIVAAVWLRDWSVVVVLGTGIGVGVACSAVIGFTLPTLLHQLKWNPQVAAGPICLAGADMLTLLVYFNLARLFF